MTARQRGSIMVAAAKADSSASIGQIIEAAVGSVAISPTRERIDEGDLAELGTSIKSEGQHVACEAWIVEPGIYMLNDGGRRLKAIRREHLPTIKLVIIPEPTEEQKLRRQLVPQGLPLHPIDECRLYERFAKLGFGDAEIADFAGVKPEHVKQRKVLLRLSAGVQALYISGKLSEYVAFTIARMTSNAQIQEKAAKKIVSEHVDDDRALWFLRRMCVLPLAIAPWDSADASLKSGKTDLPSCDKCEKHTLAQTDLWGDLYERRTGESRKEDFCLDGECYQAKLADSATRAMKEAEQKKIPVLTPAEVKKNFDAHNHASGEAVRGVNYQSPWVDADHVLLGNTHLSGPAPRSRLKREPDALAIDQDGMPRWLYNRKSAQAAERKAKREKPAKKSKADVKHEEQLKAEREKERKRELVTAAIIKAAAAKARKVSPEKLVIAVTRALVRGDDVTAGSVALARGLADGAEQLEKRVAKLSLEDASDLLVEMVATLVNEHDYNDKGRARELAQDLGVDIKAVGKSALKAPAK
jgi:ParB/RepB/Spo0J family partition protein